MEKIDLNKFVNKYSSTEFDKIKFDWNNKHGDELVDKNLQFRKKLIEYIIPNINSVSLELIRDLYIELSKFSKEAWGTPKFYNILGQELLLRDFKMYLLDYIDGATKSMDTYISSGQIKIPANLAEEITEYIKERLSYEKDERIIELLQSGAGLNRFQWLSQTKK